MGHLRTNNVFCSRARQHFDSCDTFTVSVTNLIRLHVYSTSTRAGEGAIYRYLSRHREIKDREIKDSGEYPQDEVEWIIS